MPTTIQVGVTIGGVTEPVAYTLKDTWNELSDAEQIAYNDRNRFYDDIIAVLVADGKRHVKAQIGQAEDTTKNRLRGE